MGLAPITPLSHLSSFIFLTRISMTNIPWIYGDTQVEQLDATEATNASVLQDLGLDRHIAKDASVRYTRMAKEG